MSNDNTVSLATRLEKERKAIATYLVYYHGLSDELAKVIAAQHKLNGDLYSYVKTAPNGDTA